MKKKGYYEYDPVIYPRMLCVAIGMNQEDANKCFEGRNGGVLRVDFSNADAITYDNYWYGTRRRAFCLSDRLDCVLHQQGSFGNRRFC